MPQNLKIIIIVLFLFIYTVAYGLEIVEINSNNINSITESDIFITVSPNNPTARAVATVFIESYTVDLSSKDIVWFVDQKLKKREVGLKEISFETGEIGSYVIVDVGIQISPTDTIRKTITIKPSEIDLIWETNTLVPPFYKGRSLNTSESEIKIIAIPDFVNQKGEKIDPKNLIYKWKKNSRLVNTASGYGKNSFIFIGPQSFEVVTITVEISSLDEEMRSTKSVKIFSSEPKILFYENNPLLGTIFEKAITNKDLTQDETSILAFPFFFSGNTKNDSNLKYTWTMNGQKINGNLKSKINIRKNKNMTGSTQISLSIENISKIMQLSNNNFNVILKKEEIGSSF